MRLISREEPDEEVRARDPSAAGGRSVTRLEQLSALGQSVWIDFLSRDLIESGGLERAIEEDAVVGVTSNPTHLRESPVAGPGLRRPDRKQRRRCSPASSTRWRCVTSLRPATCCGRSGSGPEAATDTFNRGRPEPRGRHGRLDRPGDALPRDDCPSEPAGEDPGDRCWRSRDRGDDRARTLDQRHVDFLARSSPASGRGLSARA